MFAFYCILPVIDDRSLIRIKDYTSRETLYIGLCENFKNDDYLTYTVEWIYAAGSELIIELKDTNCN